MPTAITTSTAATATAYSNQRKVDRTSNGVAWAMDWNGASSTTDAIEFWYSTDGWATKAKGGTFGFAGTGTTYTPNGSWFIDADDYAHVGYKDRDTGFIYYRRGTPNATRTAWTWSGATALTGSAPFDYPDIVAHREDTGWQAHVVFSQNQSTSTDRVWHLRIPIAADGTVGPNSSAVISAVYGNTVPKWPSIDFNHTGDGKTVTGGTPHLYVAWSAGATGAGKGIRFRKATYSAGSWDWGTGTEREIDPTRRIDNGNFRWLVCMFDGTRAVIAGQPFGTTQDVVIYERDAADTTTTTRVLLTDVAAADVLNSGSASYDGSGNVYFAAADFSGASNGNHKLNHRKWTRSSDTLGPITTVDTTAPESPFVSAKRGYSNSRIEFVYTDGTASPYTVTYDSILLETPNPLVMIL
jgi:hypothetical protein